jgi:hypothetical protein
MKHLLHSFLKTVLNRWMLLISDIHNIKLARTRLDCLRKAQPLVASSPPHFEIKVADVLPCIAIPAPSLLEMQALWKKLHADCNRSGDKARASIRNERHLQWCGWAAAGDVKRWMRRGNLREISFS